MDEVVKAHTLFFPVKSLKIGINTMISYTGVKDTVTTLKLFRIMCDYVILVHEYTYDSERLLN